MAPTIIHVSENEIRAQDASRVTALYPRVNRPLARRIEDTVSIQLPGDDTPQEIQDRLWFCHELTFWPLLPWVAYLGDSHYLRVLKSSIVNFRLIKTEQTIFHVPEKKRWEDRITEQLYGLDDLLNKSKIPKRLWKQRRNNLTQYLLGDG